MPGSPIGSGIGIFDEYGAVVGGPVQVANLSGFIQVQGSDDEEGESVCMDLDGRLVQGNDIELRLRVYDLSYQEIDYSQITAVVWTLKDSSGTLIISKSLGDGIVIDTIIRTVIDEEESDLLSGTYQHEFVLEFNGDSVATVVSDTELDCGTFYFRKKIASI